MPMVRTMPAMPGRVRVALQERQPPSRQQDVEHEGEVGDDAARSR